MVSDVRRRVGFRDRHDGGRALAERLGHLAGQDAVVLGLPRGGVPVAAEVARRLHLPLDVLVVRKIGHPRQPELAVGAIGEGGVRVVDPARSAGLDLDAIEARERGELERRVHAYRGGRPMRSLAGRTAVVVDDGIATGATARAACLVARAVGAKRIVLATPVAAPDAVVALRSVADEIVTVEEPRSLRAVGEWYDDFSPTTDAEVLAALQGDTAAGEVALDLGDVVLPGRIVVPAGATALVVFAHGSGSSRHSPRNRAVADVLQSAGLGTLLFDLLTPREEAAPGAAFDIERLADRLVRVLRLLREQPALDAMAFGCFGASTGAAAALVAAATAGSGVGAVVSRGGRPDLAGDRLGLVAAPTLLVVGGCDEDVLGLNRQAAARLRCEHELVVVPGATHLFEEPGTLEQVAGLARDWFVRHLRR